MASHHCSQAPPQVLQNTANSHAPGSGVASARSLLRFLRHYEQVIGSSPLKDEEVAQSILAYLAEHPQAMDTAEGIADWWIMRQQVRVTATAVARVLHQLAERGLLEEVGEGDTRRYRLKR